jgi:hypothetical protein
MDLRHLLVLCRVHLDVVDMESLSPLYRTAIPEANHSYSADGSCMCVRVRVCMRVRVVDSEWQMVDSDWL